MTISARWFSLLVLLGACAREPAPLPELAGTQWRFPPARGVPGADPAGNTVTFLADGTVHFSGLPEGSTTAGHWTKDGDELVFDCNAFTEYRVVIDGPRMTGQWKRLAGGESHVTSLVREGAVQ